MNWTQDKISVKDLQLWNENARFPEKYFNKSEEELIEYFCDNKNFKIESFAKEIIKDFDLPQLEKMVVLNIESKYVVKEGNRRLVVYKLLDNPNLAPNDTIKNKFIELKSNIDNNTILLDCLVTSNNAEALRFIERKHLNSNNEIAWGEQERVNHNISAGKANQKEKFKSEIAKVIKELDIPDKYKEKVLGKGYVSNFWRIMDSSAAKDTYGFSFNDKKELEIYDSSFNDKLKVVILNILEKKDFSGNAIDSRTLNTTKDKKKYLESITDKEIDLVDKKIINANRDLFNEKIIEKPKTIIMPKTTSRKYLIPKTCRLNIKEAKINNIYHELRENLLLDHSNNATPNAVGVLFRVFLEVSLDFYAKKNGWTFKESNTVKEKIPWVVKSLEEKGNDSKVFNYINKVYSTPKEKTYLSIDNFHEYVHSCKIQPTPSELKIKWDNLENFFCILWKSLEENN